MTNYDDIPMLYDYDVPCYECGGFMDNHEQGCPEVPMPVMFGLVSDKRLAELIFDATAELDLLDPQSDAYAVVRSELDAMLRESMVRYHNTTE